MTYKKIGIIALPEDLQGLTKKFKAQGLRFMAPSSTATDMDFDRIIFHRWVPDREYIDLLRPHCGSNFTVTINEDGLEEELNAQ